MEHNMITEDEFLDLLFKAIGIAAIIALLIPVGIILFDLFGGK